MICENLPRLGSTARLISPKSKPWHRAKITSTCSSISISTEIAAVTLYGLSAGELYRNEGLRALVGAECLRGHWIVPTLYGEPILTKPPLAYWLIALVSAPFGQVTAWSARLPSALAAVVTTLLVFAHFRRTAGEWGAQQRAAPRASGAAGLVVERRAVG